MPIRTSGGVFSSQVLTGSLVHYVVCGANFSGAIDSFGNPVPNSAAEIIFNRIQSGAYVNIMNPNDCNLSFALEADRSIWDETSLTIMIQSLGTDVGVDHIDCSLCTVQEVPYVWSCGTGGANSFLDLVDTPSTYAGSAGYVVTVNPAATGLIFTPSSGGNAFSNIAVALQPTISAVGSDTITFIAGSNIVLTTNALAKTLKIDATGSTSDYIPVPPGTLLSISTRYFVTSSGTVTLPSTVAAGFTAGKSIIIAKRVTDIIFVDVGAITDIIATDLGTTNSIEFDATQEIIFVFDGISTWNLQIGSAT